MSILRPRGQTLVIFALFLLVLVGVSALAIDYANWLLIDRRMQNVSDHAALAGASVYNQNIDNGSCSVNGPLCVSARTQSWASLNNELGLALSDAQIACLAASDTPADGLTNASGAGCTAAPFGRRIFVTTPPPNIGSYTNLGGRLTDNFGIVWVRVDEPTRSFLGGVFGITPNDRIGWATAGVLPNDFALEIYCRDDLPLAGGNCSSTQGAQGSLAIDGDGGITIDRGDIGSANSLWVSSNVGAGVVVADGNVFLTEGECDDPGSGGKWNCPPATQGGITDGNGVPQNAFHIPPLGPRQYALPAGIDNADCTAGPCVPGAGGSATPIDWSCSGSSCGYVTIPSPGRVTCTGLSGSDLQHLSPVRDETTNNFRGTSGGGNIYPNVDGAAVDPAGTTIPLPPSGSTPFPSTPGPTDYVYSRDGQNATYIVRLDSPNGLIPTGTQIYARFVMFKTQGNSGAYDSLPNSGYNVTVRAQIVELVSGAWQNVGADSGDLPANHEITAYQIPQASYANLSTRNNPTLGLKFTVTSDPGTGNSDPLRRGAGISWAEIYLDSQPVPPPPPMIPPGLYRSITIDGGCAVLDPTGFYRSPAGISQNQLPGIYYFKDYGGGNNAKISLSANSYLIGDGVSLVFDPNWPDPTGGAGITLAANAALVINTGTSIDQDCSQWLATNMSYPLCPLPFDALGAAWMVDPADPMTGMSPWGGPCSGASPCDVGRSSYAPATNYRGISFYMRVASWPPSSTLARFQIQGSSGNEPGISFQGLLYAPYDNVKLTGGNGFNNVGQVIAWTAKFAGQATIHLTYPYARCAVTDSCLPYLLEPTVGT